MGSLTGMRIAGLAVLLLGAPAAARAQGIDPPARVARLSRVTGTVSFHLAGAERWEPAPVNLPVTAGTVLWTEPAARAELGFPGARMALDGETELDMTLLDTHAAVATVPQGALYVGLRFLPQGDTVTVQTPRGTVALRGTGHYEVAAGDTARATVVTVVDGGADVTGAGLTVHVGPNQAAVITGDGATSPYQASLAAATRDAFLAAELAEEQPPRQPAVAPPAYVAAMTGGEALDDVGEWQSVPDYGTVWFPPTEAGFVPYRHGHWAWVAPWGWTWVDDAPWGFAPFHYGRWAAAGERWFWVPGPAYGPGGPSRGSGYSPIYSPVYAPALVAFVGGAALGALSAPAVGWFPLGPRDPYVPPYRTSPGYARQFAAFEGVGPGGGLHGGPPPFANRAAATVVPAAVMATGAGVAASVQPVAIAASAPVIPRSPVTPTLATPGVTPAVARQFRIPQPGSPVPGAVSSLPSAPGPAIAPGLRPGIRPPLARAAAPPPGVSVPPGAAAPAGQPAAPRPGLPPGSSPGLPALRQPGAESPRPNGGAPGPALPSSPVTAVPSATVPAVIRPEPPGAERPGGRGILSQPGSEPGPRAEPPGAPNPAVIRPEPPGSARPGGPGILPQPGAEPRGEPGLRAEPPGVPLPTVIRPEPPPVPHPPAPAPAPRPGPAVHAPASVAPPRVAAPSAEAPRALPRPVPARPPVAPQGFHAAVPGPVPAAQAVRPPPAPIRPPPAVRAASPPPAPPPRPAMVAQAPHPPPPPPPRPAPPPPPRPAPPGPRDPHHPP